MKLINYYEDPKTLHVGAIPDRAYLVPHACAADAAAKLREESERLVLLNGRWQFGYYPCVEDVPEDFFRPGFDDSGFGGIDVPGCWQPQGYDRYHYVGARCIIPYDLPHVPADNPAGAYIREFWFDPDEKTPVTELVFEGVDSCYYVWLNGEQIGYSQVSHATSIFDISRQVRPGWNRLAVLNLKWCDGTYLEVQDKFRLTGIFRDVYLLRRAATRVEDFFIRTQLSDGCRRASVTVDFTLSGADESKELTAALYAPDGKEIGSEKAKAAQSVQLTFQVEDAKLWNAEQPNLYKLVFTVDGESAAQTVALREVSVENGVLKLNGAPIKIKGVNRHDSDPVTGYAVDRAHILRDLTLMKENNINAIRTSHYPNSPIVMDYCDQMGFYVMAEADYECHGISSREGAEESANPDDPRLYNIHTPVINDDPLYRDAILDRVKKPPIRDKNYGCILFWSLGNESGWGENLEIAARWVKEYDPSRLLHYENLFPALDRKPDYSDLDVISRMYPSTGWIRQKYEPGYSFDPADDNIVMCDKATEAYYLEASKTHPLVLCEYIHAMGNGPGDAEDYVSLIYKHERFAGGFVWEWCDHARYMGKTPDGRPMYWYGGDSGEFPTDSDFCMDGLNYPDRRPHTGLLEYKNCIRPARASLKEDNRTVVLENKLDFTDLADYMTVRFELTLDGAVVQSGDVPLPAVPPRQSREIGLPLTVPAQGSAYLLLIYSLKRELYPMRAGHALGFDQMKLELAAASVSPLAQTFVGKMELEAAEYDRVIVIQGCNERGRFRYKFDKKKGVFSSLVAGDAELLLQPMEYNIYRAPTDNDKGFGGILPDWKAIGYDRAVTRIYGARLETGEGRVRITTPFAIASVYRRNAAEGTTVWEITPDGVISVASDVKRPAHLVYLPRFGLRLFLNKLDQVRYYGYGPTESYIDKHHAAWMGLFQAAVQELHEDYVFPQENGSHYGCEYLRVSDEQGRHGLQVTPETGGAFSFNASPYTQEQLDQAAHNYELTQPRDRTVLCVDYKMSGVGSMACGPVLLEQYRLAEEEFRFAVRFLPM